MNPTEWRRAAEARIEELLDASWRLIEALDAMEIDPDLEPDLEGEPGAWSEGGDFARKFDQGDGDENREDDGTGEPSLGSPEIHHRQIGWCRGGSDDREEDDEREDDPGENGIGDAEGLQEQAAMGEPDLGWSADVDQHAALAPLDESTWIVIDGEPSLGWTGYGRGVAEGETTDDREGDDEREEDPAEAGIADSDALHAVI